MQRDIVDLKGSQFEDNKYPAIEALRAQDFYAPVDGGYVFLNAEEARWVFKCVDFRFDFFQIDRAASQYLADSIENELLNMHGKPHERLKRIVMSALKDKIVDGLKDRIRSIARSLIAKMPDEGAVDLCTEFADPFPAEVLGPMFDIPYSDISGLNDWIRIGGRKVDALQSGDGIEAVEQANRNMHAYLKGLLEERRKKPGDDIFSALMEAEIDGERLTDRELLALAGELASAGVDTTRSQLPLILADLLSHRAQLNTLENDPSLASQAVEEGMRYSPLPWALPHRALRDLKWKGLHIKQGDLAMVLVPAANRDPKEVDAPNTFDITRPRQRNFSFGYGMHACPGAHLARMEMEIALKEITSQLELISFAEEPVRDPHTKGSAPRHLKVQIRKRQTRRQKDEN